MSQVPTPPVRPNPVTPITIPPMEYFENYEPGAEVRRKINTNFENIEDAFPQLDTILDEIVDEMVRYVDDSLGYIGTILLRRMDGYNV